VTLRLLSWERFPLTSCVPHAMFARMPRKMIAIWQTVRLLRLRGICCTWVLRYAQRRQPKGDGEMQIAR